MNVVVDPYESIFEYLGPVNVIVLPITTYVKKSTGELSVVEPVTKEAFERFPFLSKRWGYLMDIGVTYPTYRSSDMILLGVPTKDHYAAKDNEIFIEGSLIYIADLAFQMSDKLFYLEPLGDLETTIRLLDGVNNAVILDYERTVND